MKRFLSTIFILGFAFLVMIPSVAHAVPIPPKTGAMMCAALNTMDFQSVGLAASILPSANVQDGGASAYCVYSGKSSATGGIELDVFYPAGATPAEAKATEDTAMGESSSPQQAIAVPGADSAHWSPNAVSGGPPFAVITVRRGTLVFVLGIPAGKNSRTQLLKLAETVLKRF